MTINEFLNLKLICNDLFMFQFLADIEEHLGVTIEQVQPNMKIPVNEFDGKVTYGQKRKFGKKNKNMQICVLCFCQILILFLNAMKR